MEKVHIILGAPNKEPLGKMIPKDDVIIGVDRGALMAIEEGLELNIALGDFDSITQEESRIVHNKSKLVLNFPTDKDDTDAEIALLYVLENFPEAQIYLYNWYGGRIDHLYSILLLVLQKRFEQIIPKLHYVSEKNYVSFFLPGKHTVNKIYGLNYLSFILLSAVEDLTLENVKYTLFEQDFEKPMSLISNEFLDDQASFSFSNGIIAVVQSVD